MVMVGNTRTQKKKKPVRRVLVDYGSTRRNIEAAKSSA
jgi:hypothetical protein